MRCCWEVTPSRLTSRQGVEGWTAKARRHSLAYTPCTSHSWMSRFEGMIGRAPRMAELQKGVRHMHTGALEVEQSAPMEFKFKSVRRAAGQ